MSRRSIKARINSWLPTVALIGVPLLVIAGYFGLKHYESTSFIEEGQACMYTHGQYVCKGNVCHCFK